ncbi:peptidoglycan-binding domain-containing protein [uncultured Microbulbifer sp.]|uniref:peptidoglycan-binding domain-containing protein n=1 Tax=uncultured Microbulbifer sp. TaxID=348147 RepID=UPI00262337B9|nr:peptidoglycan-binding domain-containing protein [uncultured Microbulbifer sp.]
MPKGLLRPVGVSGTNDVRDVRLVQMYLNSFAGSFAPLALLDEDGLIGTKTIAAIKHFQRNAVGMRYPDGRVDPEGKTFRYLTMYFSEVEQNAVEQVLVGASPKNQPEPVSNETVNAKAGLNNLIVSYGDIASERRIVDPYSIEVIKLALKESGMNRAVITSTFRTPDQQARIMLKNGKKDLKAQFRLYGANGDKVLRVYADNKSKSDDEIVELMKNAIVRLGQSGQRVSKHCVGTEEYKKLNIFDIGVNSTRAVCKGFNIKKFTSCLNDLVSEGYIEKLIDETGKSNSCWHIEIKPNKKPLQEYAKGSILKPIKYVSEG